MPSPIGYTAIMTATTERQKRRRQRAEQERLKRRADAWALYERTAISYGADYHQLQIALLRPAETWHEIAAAEIARKPVADYLRGHTRQVVVARGICDCALALARYYCADERHDMEYHLGHGVADFGQSDELVTIDFGWQNAVRGLHHLFLAAHHDQKDSLATGLRDCATEAVAWFRRQVSGGLKASSLTVQRWSLDVFGDALAAAEEYLYGRPRSELALDVRRRERARKAKSKGTSPTFWQRHREGLLAIWRRDGKEWYFEQYRLGKGHDPPPDWWIDNPRTAVGGQINPKYFGTDELYDLSVDGTFFREMERRYREEKGLPARGEKYVSQIHLLRTVEKCLPGEEVIREASPDWLKPQRLDIYVPGRALAFEYQGEQHYLPLEHMGGEQGLEDRRQTDERKRRLCREAGVTLIEWRFDEPITEEAVRSRL